MKIFFRIQTSPSTESDDKTSVDICYYNMNYWIHYKKQYNSTKVSTSGNVMLGPMGEKSLWGRKTIYYFWAFPQYVNLSTQLSIELNITRVIYGIDSMFRPSLIKHIYLYSFYDICIRKTYNKIGELYWTAQGCQPILRTNISLIQHIHRMSIGERYGVECQCDWESDSPIDSMAGHSVKSRSIYSFDEKDVENDGLILVIILSIICLLIAIVLTLFLVIISVKYKNSMK